jgi:hypothetical protein
MLHASNFAVALSSNININSNDYHLMKRKFQHIFKASRLEAHIPCGLQHRQAGEAHGICALAGLKTDQW